MSDKFAKTYNLASNRAIKQKAPEKKVIFRGVLDNAFRVQWYVLTTICIVFLNVWAKALCTHECTKGRTCVFNIS